MRRQQNHLGSTSSKHKQKTCAPDEVYLLNRLTERFNLQIGSLKSATGWQRSSKVNRIFQAIKNLLTALHKVLFNLTLTFFEELNRQIRSRMHPYFMEQETKEHVKALVKVFKYVILPASLFYVISNFLLLRENALDSMLLGIALFIYSNFLPDLPSICRRSKNSGTTKDLPCYKKYALLLFAPLFIWALFSGTQLRWKTTETFHNLKSLTVYSGFLLILGLLFIYPPITIADLTELASTPLYGLIGYLTHLRVDKIL